MAAGGGRGRGGRWKVTPNLAADQKGTRLLNLTVLRRLDPAVADILITAAHVTTYSFDEGIHKWSRKAVEGSLFVVKRNTQPRFQFIIMNRRNTENLVEDLLRDFEYQVQVPYIMYRNASDEVTGIWFYNPQECEEVAHLFSRIHNAFSRASPKAKVSAIKSEFEDPEVVPSVPSAEDTVEQPTSSTMVPDDVEYKFLSALTKAAACVGATAGGTGAVQPNQSVGMAPSSSHASPSVISSQSPALHSPFPSQTSSAPVMPLDTHRSSSAPTIQPASLVKPLLFPPVTSSQTTMAPVASSLTAAPPLHPPRTIQQWQNTTLLQPFPLPTASRPPPHGAPLLQPFPPPKPSALLTPAPSYGPVLTRDKVRAAMVKLVQNDDFIDIIYREIVKGQYL